MLLVNKNGMKRYHHTSGIKVLVVHLTSSEREEALAEFSVCQYYTRIEVKVKSLI